MIMSDSVRETGINALLTTREVAELLRVNRSTLSRWRSLGVGPRITWLSPSIPRYQRSDVLEWLRRAAA
jgi:predicted DNA-binding transcriptional regulator AlpA